MIKRRITYTEEHKDKIKKAYKDFTYPQYLGEKGDMIAVRAISPQRALEKIRTLEMETGEKTREEVEEIKLEDLSIGYVQLVDDKNKNHDSLTAGDYDDFVSLEEKSDYPVYVYCI